MRTQVVERVLQLRARLPADQITHYSRQEHLNETDSQLLAQSLAEMVCLLQAACISTLLSAA